MYFSFAAQWLPCWVQPLVVKRDESSEVSLPRHRLWLFHWRWDQKVHPLERENAAIWAGAWRTVTSVYKSVLNQRLNLSSLSTDHIFDQALSVRSCSVFQTVLVHTSETICLTYFIDLLLQRGKPIMLVGNAGAGKTILVSDKVAKLKEDYMVAKVPFNYYTTSAMLQRK